MGVFLFIKYHKKVLIMSVKSEFTTSTAYIATQYARYKDVDDNHQTWNLVNLSNYSNNNEIQDSKGFKTN